MASVVKRQSGAYNILFYFGKPYQQKIYTSIRSKRDAERLADKVQTLIDCHKAGIQNDELNLWASRLRDTDSKLYKRLSELGLVSAPGAKHTLRDLVEAYLAQSTAQDATKLKYRHTAAILYELAGADAIIEDITVETAERIVTSFRTEPLNRCTRVPRVYSTAQANRSIVRVKTFFGYAERVGWVQKSPFRFAKGGACVNSDRWEYVPRDTVRELLAKMKNRKWAAIIALGRFAGCRGTSELHNLRWDMVDFAAKTVTLYAMKKDGREDAERTIPMCDVLAQALADWRSVADEESPMVFLGMDRYDNLSVPVSGYVTSLVAKPWQESWYNLRRSFCSDVMESGVEPKMYEIICGHSFATGMKHYQILHPDRQRRGFEKVADAMNK